MALPCLGGARGMRGAVSLTVYTEGRSLGWANIFQGKVWSSGEKTASFPGRKVSSCRTWCLGSGSAVASEEGCTVARGELLPSLGGRWAIAWLGRPPDAWILGVLFPSEEGCTVARGELLPSPGGRWAIAWLGRPPDAWILGVLFPSEEGCTVTGRELLPSPGGRWAIARLGRLPNAWILGELLPSEEGCTVAGGELLPSPGGRWAIASVGRLPMTWLAGLGWLLITWLLPWGGPVPSGRRWPVAKGLSHSPGGRRAMAGMGLWGFAWLTWLLRLLCEFKLFGLVLLNLVIFPSFLFISKLNLFSCLCLTLLNLLLLTLSMKSWHSLSC